MINLDDASFVQKTASGQVVLTSINAYPDQCKQAWAESSKMQFPAEYKKIKNIVVCGMGGSRFTPLIVKELFKEEISVPYVVNDNYSLPGYVNTETLVILSSYSGTTEEIIQCGLRAKKREAKIAGICLGGQLGQFLTENNYPAYLFKATYNPSNQPRIGVGYMTAGHMGLLYASGFLQIDPQSMETTIESLADLLQDYQIDRTKEVNLAKQMALSLYDRYPYYIAAEHLQGVVNAIANQTNETAKLISSYRYIPELNHHLMEGLKFPESHKNEATFVFFPSAQYDPRVKTRFNITKEVVEKNGIKTLIHTSKGTDKVTQALELIGFGSYMTMYLSALYEQDPSLIPWVDYFKKRLQELSK